MQLDATILRLVELKRLLHIVEKIAEDWPHRGHDLLGVFAGCAFLLELVALRILEFRGWRECLENCFGETVSAEGETSHPAARADGDDEIGRRSSDVE